MPDTLFQWLEATPVAAAIVTKPLLMAVLSGFHLIGLTLLVGGALASLLQLAGLLLPERPVSEVSRALGGAMLVGLGLSLGTGLLLFLPQASNTAANPKFQVKMLLLLTAIAFHFTAYRSFTRREGAPPIAMRVLAGIGPVLWFGVAVAGSVFILFE